MKKNLFLRPAIGTSLILLIPLVMTILDRRKAEGEGWRWSPGDFIVMGSLLFGAGLIYELMAGKLQNSTHKLVLGIAIFFVVFVIWVELAVDGVSQLVGFLAG